jgi:cytochrome c-type biogenesis protein CcmH/NrfF
MRLLTLGWLVALALVASVPAQGWTQPAPDAQTTSRSPAAPPTAAEAAAEVQARALFTEVMSPFCPGLTLADCPSPNAFTMRGDIERRLKNGESRQAIVDELVRTYGAQILADPSDTPIGSIVWGVPFAVSALAAAGLAFFLRRATRRRTAEAITTQAESPQMRSRVDEELAAMD